MKKVTGLIILITMIIACSTENNENSLKELLAADSAFAKLSVKENAAAAFRDFMSEDGLQFRPNREPVMGNVLIYKMMEPSSKNYILEWVPQSAEIAKSGDLGWTWGKYYVFMKDSAKTMVGRGKYVNIWKKNANGEWKVRADVGVQDELRQ